MSNSVAGQIRIDLIAQAAQFSSGMREGKQELGSFQEQFEKFNRSFESQKSIAARIGAEKDAWSAAMKGLRGEISAGGNSMLPWYGLERVNARNNLAEDNRIRFQSMIPWGNSFRVELSRQAAETAALIGQHKQSLIKEFAHAAERLGGEVPGVGRMASGLMGLAADPLAWAVGGGVAAVGFGAEKTYESAQERDRRIREAHEASLQIGQSAEDTSKLLGIGFETTMLSKFQKAIADQTPEQQAALKKMGLSPDELGTQPLSESLEKVSEAFEKKVGNSADRASIAMHLFGKSGAQVIETLEEMQNRMGRLGEHEIISAQDIERVKAYDHAVKQWENVKEAGFLKIGRAFGSESGIGTAIERGLAWLGSDEEGQKRIEQEKEADEYRIKHADELEAIRVKQEELNAATERYNTALKHADDSIQHMKDAALRSRLGEEGLEREKTSRKLMAELGITRDVRGDLKGNWQNIKAYNRKMSKFDDAAMEARSERQNEEERKRQERKKDELEKEHERELKNKEKQEEDEAKEFFRRRDEFKSKLRSREQAAHDELGDLMGNRDILTADEFRRGRASIGEKLLSEMGNVSNQISPIAAMEAGSAAAHSAIVQANMPDPKLALMQNISTKIDQMIAEIKIANGDML